MRVPALSGALGRPFILGPGRRQCAIPTGVRRFAFARVLDNAVKLVITGDGPKSMELAAVIAPHGFGERVQLLGQVSREENHRLLRQSLFCVFSALREVFGHFSLEAMAAWKPVIPPQIGKGRKTDRRQCDGIQSSGKKSV
jgi:hypothetical protein